MKLEQQVTSLELSKRLKELGVKQESIWYWVKSNQTAFPNPTLIRDFEYEESKSFAPAFQYQYAYSAFTLAELFEMMPMMYVSLEQHSNSYRAGIPSKGQYGQHENPTGALGLMLEYLIKNNLLTI